MKEYRIQIAAAEKSVQVFADRAVSEGGGVVKFYRGQEIVAEFRFPHIAGYWLAEDAGRA
jgi:hypothetical protein